MVKKILIILVLLFVTKNAGAATSSPFFAEHDTWKEPIPANMTAHDESSEYIDRILASRSGGALFFTSGGWSIPIFLAEVGDPTVTITQVSWAAETECGYDPNTTCWQWRIDLGWDLNVPMPSEARGASSGDGVIVIISADGNTAYDMHAFNYANNECSALYVEDLTGHDVPQPWTTPDDLENRGIHLTQTSSLGGLVTYAEVAAAIADPVNDPIDHAIAMSYGGANELGNQNYYGNNGAWYPGITRSSPTSEFIDDCYSVGECSQMNNTGWFDHLDAPWIGMRFQLDMTDAEIEAIWGATGSNPMPGKFAIAKALQNYGMIYVENAGAGDGANIYLEDLEYDSRTWYDAAVEDTLGTPYINMSDFRLISGPLTPPLSSVCTTIPGDGIMDNDSTHSSEDGTWTTSSAPNPYGSDSVESDSPNGAHFWWCANDVTGTMDVYAWWTYQSDRSSAAVYDIYDSNKLLDSKQVSQLSNGGQWNWLGTYTFTEAARVRLTSIGGATTSADAIKIVAQGGGDPPAETIVIDDGDAETSSAGTWSDSGATDGYDGDSVYSLTADETYTYTSTGTTGDKEISVWWSTWGTRCSSGITVKIYDDTTLMATFSDLDQSGDQGFWYSLGEYTFSTSVIVEITSSGLYGCSTCADAVKIEDASGASPTTTTLSSAGGLSGTMK